LKISIIDTGIGIKDEHKNKLFSEYGIFTKENNELGSGLGLHITKKIANELGYKIVALSQESVGTKMKVYIPLENQTTAIDRFYLKSSSENINHEEDQNKTLILNPLTINFNYNLVKYLPITYGEDSDSNCSRFLESEQSGEHSLCEAKSKPIIIVIDDQQFIRSILVNNLKKLIASLNSEYEIIEGNDGIDCLKLFIDYTDMVKCIFIDENMIYMNGTQTARIIKSLPNTKFLPKLVLTTADCVDNFHGNEIYDAFLSKPVTKTSLQELISLFRL
jgi:CheY-like chemotaxis protein